MTKVNGSTLQYLNNNVMENRSEPFHFTILIDLFGRQTFWMDQFHFNETLKKNRMVRLSRNGNNYSKMNKYRALFEFSLGCGFIEKNRLKNRSLLIRPKINFVTRYDLNRYLWTLPDILIVRSYENFARFLFDSLIRGLFSDLVFTQSDNEILHMHDVYCISVDKFQ